MSTISGYARQVKITYSAAKVPSNQTDFPMRDNQDTTPSEALDLDGLYPMNPDGSDVRYSLDAAGTIELAREIGEVSLNNNPALSKFESIVRIPTAAAAGGDIYKWYHKPSASEPAPGDPNGRHNTWKSSIVGRWNLGEYGDGTSLEYLESTSNGNNGTGGGGSASKTPSQVIGKIGNAQDADGVDDYVEDGTSSDYHFNKDTPFSISMWVNFDALGSYDMLISRIKDDPGPGTYSGWDMFKTNDDKIEFQLSYDWGAANRLAVYTTSALSSATPWYFITCTYNGSGSASGVKIYVDGVDQSLTTRYNALTLSHADPVRPLMIGGREVGGSQWNSLAGLMDEVRIHNVVLTQDWITTAFNTQSDPSTFLTVGTPQSVTLGENVSIDIIK